jgi:enhancing lycopene biosynthesis protein 2
VLKQFNSAKKPIGLCCIAPVLAAKVFPGCQVTVGCATKSVSLASTTAETAILICKQAPGMVHVLPVQDEWPYADTAAAIDAMGSKHVETTLEEIHVDETFGVVTAPAFMCDMAIHRVHDNVAMMVNEVVKRA